MKLLLAATLATAACALPLAAAHAAGPVAAAPVASGPVASAQDKAFVAMVSQGGMFEVKAGQLAADQGSTQDIRDQGNTESHDHDGVGAKLTTAAGDAGISFSTDLNDGFTKELAELKSKTGPAFDALYLKDMEAIHAKDGAAFHKEATAGANPALKAFAAETYRIVQRHIGELKAIGPAR